MTSSLNEERNERFRFFRQFSRESVLVTLVAIAVTASAISWNRAERAIDAANESSAIATTWQTMYKETERECRLAQLEIDDFKIILVRAGFDTHDGERP